MLSKILNRSYNYILLLINIMFVNHVKAEFLTLGEFQKCVSAIGYGDPSNETFIQFSQKSRKLGAITSKLESLMALSHLITESKAFTIKSDPNCSHSNQTDLCVKYRREENCPKNNTYYGRGFIGLKYCYNYRAVSNELYGDQRLVLNPDIVSENDSVAMDTALTYWKIKVHKNLVKSKKLDHFGYTTDFLGREECAEDITKAKLKWFNFNQCLEKSGNNNFKRSEDGCYPLDEHGQAPGSFAINTNLIAYLSGALILLILISLRLFLFVRRSKKSRNAIANRISTIDNIYSDLNIYEYELNNDCDYESLGHDDYVFMATHENTYDKLSLNSFNSDIYLPMKNAK